MGIFGRMKTLLKANVNDLASKAENPELVLNQLILDMEDQLRAAKLEVRDTITDQKQLEKKLEAALAASREWERKAMIAVEAGKDDLAREALGRKQEADSQAAEHQIGLEQQKAAADQLKVALRNLATKIEEAKRKKNVLVARAKKAELTQSMANSSGVGGDTSAFDSFERQAGKIENLEAEVAASGEIDDTLQFEELDSKFRGLEEDHGAHDALAELKRKMGKSDD